MLILRSLTYVVLFYLWTAVTCVVCTPLLFAPRRWSLAMFSGWSRVVIAMLAICDVKVEVRGREFMPTGPALIAPKHQCMLDVFAQFSILPSSCFVTKKELSWIPWFSWYAMKVRSIFVDREAGAAALRKLVRDATAIFADNRQVVIFPEGTRKAPGSPTDYQPGVAGLYRDLGLPCTPLATNSGAHWPPHGFLRRPGVIVYEFLPPIPAGLHRGAFMRELEERIEAASSRLLEV